MQDILKIVRAGGCPTSGALAAQAALGLVLVLFGLGPTLIVPHMNAAGMTTVL